MSDIRIERMVYGSRAQVLEAWTRPDLLPSWFSPEVSTSVYVEEYDFASGGRWRVLRGEELLDGTFLEMNAPDRFSFTWHEQDDPEETPSTVVVMLTERAEDSTEIRIDHAGFPDSDRAGARERDWNTMLERLAQLVA